MILVTGASGFLGNYLLHELQTQPMPVRALYHSKQPEKIFTNVTWQPCNLLDIYDVAEAMQGITHVYHCAAVLSFDPNKRKESIDNNIAMTANVVNAALEANVQKLIHVSSIATFGREEINGQPLIIDENTMFKESANNSFYALGKYYAEMEVWRAMAEGLNAAIINPGIILGSGDWNKGSANLMSIVHKEFPWYTSGTNGWVDAKDVVQAMMLLMQSSISDERYIITQGNYSYLEMFTMMANVLNKKPPSHRATKWITEIVWRMEYLKSKLSGKYAGITKETARTAQLVCKYDNSKFTKAFSEFSFTPMKETISLMAQNFINDLKK